MRTFALVLCLLATSYAQQWYRGNTHSHTYWSDGDGAPELVVDGYKERGYDFLVLSDHNILQLGEKWYPVKAKGRLNPKRLAALIERFGAEQVTTRERNGRQELLLKTLPELRAQFEDDGFVLIPGEEVTGHFGDAELHINALNTEQVIMPGRGAGLRESLQATLDAISAEGERLGRPVLGHINHPNYQWSLTAEDLAAVRGERFFEVYNGHRSTYNWGDPHHASLEQIWDQALSLRLGETPGAAEALLFGLASDDSHNHHGTDQHSNPGRGWVMVRAAELSADAIVAALRAGEFYASTGVALTAFSADAEGLRVEIQAEPGVSYRTEFIGTRRTDGPTPVGEILQASDANPAVYRFAGDELYVRARVVSDRLQPNPFAEGDFEMAWLQPVLGPAPD